MRYGRRYPVALVLVVLAALELFSASPLCAQAGKIEVLWLGHPGVFADMKWIGEYYKPTSS